jgi:hypothetical protein
MDSLNGSGLVAVDPLTLRDLSTQPLLSIGSSESNPCDGSTGLCALIAASPDGKALAVVRYSPIGAAGISVFDARSATLLAQPKPDAPVIVDGVSADGSKIYARSWPPGDIGAERLVLEARTGKTVSREPAISLGGDPITWISDVDGRRLYALLVQPDPNPTGPRSVEVGAWDLRTGRELWRQGVPSLVAGDWDSGAARARLVPGIALSPDGRQIAIVRAFDCCVAGGTLWLTEVGSGEILSQRTYRRDSSLFDELFGASAAAAKEMNEVIVNASFSADGRVLHVRAQSWQYDGRPEPYQYFGMAALDVPSAKLLGSDIKMEQWWYQNKILWLQSSPDGRWLYVFLERTGNADPKGYFLRRLDARTLSVLAERRFDSYRYSFMLAAP